METTKQVFWLMVLLIIGALVYLLSPVLMPFLVAAALSYLGDPLVDWLEARRIPRTVAVIIVFSIISMLLVGALLILIPTISSQISASFDNAPQTLVWFNEVVIPWLNSQFGLTLSTSTLDIPQWLQQHWQDTSEILKVLLASIGESSMALLVWLGNIVLIPVVTFYLLRDWDKLTAYIGDLIPRQYEKVIRQLVNESDEVLGAFVRGQLLVMLALGTIYSLGLWMTGLKVALLVGMLAGIASIVPYLGFFVGIISAMIAAVMQYQSIGPLLPVAIVFMVGQALEGMVLTPLLVGDKIGLHPVTVIFAVLAGGQLFGFVGILIALPAAAVGAVVIRHLHQRYRHSQYYDDSESTAKIVIDVNQSK